MFVQELIKAKEEKGLTNQQIADASGVPVGTVSRIFAGNAEDLKLYTAVNLAKVLKVSIDDFGGIQSDRKSSAKETKTEIKLPLSEHSEWTYSIIESIINKERREKRILFGCLMGVIAIVLLLFTYDIFNGSIGWFRYAEMMRSAFRPFLNM